MASLKLDGKTGRREDGKKSCWHFDLKFSPRRETPNGITKLFLSSGLLAFPSYRLFIAGSLIIALSGCDQKQQAQLGKQVNSVATNVQKTTADTVENTLQEAFQASQTGGATLRVKTALSVSSRLEGAQIDVDLQGRKIILRGTVINAAQKTIAHSIAQNTLDPKFKVVNRLVVQNSMSRKSSSDGKSRRDAP